MTAKEMFEKLGYKLRNCRDFIYYLKTKDCLHFKVITFYTNKKIVNFQRVVGIEEKEFNLTPKILQAINKQVEELGWNNENR